MTQPGNILNVPTERIHALRGSHVLDLAASSRTLFAVDEHTIHKYAFPCCKLGGACCPLENGRYPHCCAHFRVSQWMTSVLNSGGSDLQWGTRTTWYDQQWHVFGPNLQAIQHQELERNASAPDVIGLSYNTDPNRVPMRNRRGNNQVGKDTKNTYKKG